MNDERATGIEKLAFSIVATVIIVGFWYWMIKGVFSLLVH